MKRQRTVRCLVALVLGAVAGGVVPVWSCGGRGPCDPVYDGEASDEALRTILDAYGRASVGDPNAAVITVPAEGQAFPASGPPPKITWTSPIAAAPAAPGTRLARSSPGWLESLLTSVAHAHLPPVTGDVHYLEIAIPGRACEYRVLTTKLEWQIDAQAWAAMKAAAGADLAIRITSAYLVENRIREGPYRPLAPRTFRVTP